MALESSKELVYPAGLDEAKVKALLQTVIDLIDRAKLYNYEKLPLVRHPLRVERMGIDVSLNFEISRLIRAALDSNNRETILLDCSTNPTAMKENLTALETACDRFDAANPQKYCSAFKILLRVLIEQELEMPNVIQENLLPVTALMAQVGTTKKRVLVRLAIAMRDLLEETAATGETDPCFFEAIKNEAAIVEALIEKCY